MVLILKSTYKEEVIGISSADLLHGNIPEALINIIPSVPYPKPSCIWM